MVEESENQDSRASERRKSNKSKSRLRLETKYNLYSLLATKQTYEGELSRHVERQRTKIQRWLVLKKEALFIYKDKLNAKSFPDRPL